MAVAVQRADPPFMAGWTPLPAPKLNFKSVHTRAAKEPWLSSAQLNEVLGRPVRPGALSEAAEAEREKIAEGLETRDDAEISTDLALGREEREALEAAAAAEAVPAGARTADQEAAIEFGAQLKGRLRSRAEEGIAAGRLTAGEGLALLNEFNSLDLALREQVAAAARGTTNSAALTSINDSVEEVRDALGATGDLAQRLDNVRTAVGQVRAGVANSNVLLQAVRGAVEATAASLQASDPNSFAGDALAKLGALETAINAIPPGGQQGQQGQPQPPPRTPTPPPRTPTPTPGQQPSVADVLQTITPANGTSKAHRERLSFLRMAVSPSDDKIGLTPDLLDALSSKNYGAEVKKFGDPGSQAYIRQLLRRNADMGVSSGQAAGPADFSRLADMFTDADHDAMLSPSVNVTGSRREQSTKKRKLLFGKGLDDDEPASSAPVVSALEAAKAEIDGLLGANRINAAIRSVVRHADVLGKQRASELLRLLYP